MRYLLVVLLIGTATTGFSQNKPTSKRVPHGKEYFVSVNGNDTNAGSALHPFRTISAAARVAMPGDVITVHGGVYREQITPPRGGVSNERRIVYQAAKGEKVVIKGSEIIRGWSGTGNDTWMVKIPNSFFGKFNPYSDLIHGDWFWPTPKDRKYHTGAVYLNGDWLMEAANQEEVMQPADKKDPLWWATVDADSTTIWAQFVHADPNQETVEINVRQTVFYPDKPFVNYITVRGFTMEQAATNWAPPTAEQMGLIGTHWSRGWIIENNIVEYSKCAGIALGKYGDQWDNNHTESATGYVGTIRRALAFGWNKDSIGGHIVRNNTIAYCEQAGIVGSMGCAFSIVEGNTIHDIHVHKLFSGAEMAAIKFHGAVDVQILHNHIYHSCLGIWLDWMGEGAQIKSNLMHDNDLDIFLEVDHGPILVSNNILLSGVNLLMNSQGAAFVYNIFSGSIHVIPYDSRLTPYLLPHATTVTALHDNPCGDVRFFNNLFIRHGNAGQYSEALLPVLFSGNVYTKGAGETPPPDFGKRFETLSDSLKRIYPVQEKKETGALIKQDFDAGGDLTIGKKGVYLELSLDRKWLIEQKRNRVNADMLGKALIPGLPFENADGSRMSVDVDYLGRKRDTANPSPGPFEILKSGRQKIRVW